MSVYQLLLKSADDVRAMAEPVRQFIGSNAFNALPTDERAMILNELNLLLSLEGVYLSRAALYVNDAPIQRPDPSEDPATVAQLEKREAAERTYRASGICPACKGGGHAQSLGSSGVDPDVFGSSGYCRRCNGSGRYVRP